MPRGTAVGRVFHRFYRLASILLVLSGSFRARTCFKMLIYSFLTCLVIALGPILKSGDSTAKA